MNTLQRSKPYIYPVREQNHVQAEQNSMHCIQQLTNDLV